MEERYTDLSMMEEVTPAAAIAMIPSFRARFGDSV